MDSKASANVEDNVVSSYVKLPETVTETTSTATVSSSGQSQHTQNDEAVASASASAPKEDASNNNKDERSFAGKMSDFVKDLTDVLRPLAEPEKSRALSEASLEGVAESIKSGKSSSVIVLTGAGISTSAGIPDFRSPGTGLYDNLKKYKLPYPEAVFEINYFMKNPAPFFTLAKELYPQKLKGTLMPINCRQLEKVMVNYWSTSSLEPTLCHYFIRLLHEKGLLIRNYTQNIDTLEHVAGLPADKVVEAHGSFRTNHCTKCRKEFPLEWVKGKVFADEIPRCDCKAKGFVKPDIVFFGEALPKRFFNHKTTDFPQCDLLIIMGTSLVVQPFASLIDGVNDEVPRLLINREQAGSGMAFDHPRNKRDVFHKASCDDGCLKFAQLLGWEEELRSLYAKEHKRLDVEYENAQANAGTSEAVQSGSASTLGDDKENASL